MGATSRFGVSISASLYPTTGQLTDVSSSSETIKRLLAFPADTNIVWKSHDDSIAQRSAIDQARHEKGGSGPHHSQGKRRETINEDSAPEKSRGAAA